MQSLESLQIYQKSLLLVKEVYLLINNNISLSKDFSLCDQIKRASVSVPANISEGYFRSAKQTKNYFDISRGSANEVVTLLKIVSLVHRENTTSLQEKYLYLAKQISSFTNKL